MAKQLGELLIEQRLITQSMLDQALVLQQQRRLPLGKILLQLGYVTEDDLNTILARQFGSIYINPRGFVLRDANLLNLIPETIARKLNCFPIEKTNEQFTVAMSDPWDTNAIQELTDLTKATIQPIFSQKEWIIQIIDKYYPTVTPEPKEPPPAEPPSPAEPAGAPTEKTTTATGAVPPVPEPIPEKPALIEIPKPETIAEPELVRPAPPVKPELEPPAPVISPVPTPIPSPSVSQPVAVPQPSVVSIPPAPVSTPTTGAPAVPAAPLPSTTLLTQPIPEYTFESFVVGTGNQLAWAAAKNVAESPGATFNPLFIYGGVGLGKTHLANAIGNLILQRNPVVALTYIPCNRFIEEMITAIANASVNTFRQQYWHLQALIIDDVQFLAGQERTQVELFQTFEELHHRKAQIVLTSDRLPKDIPQLEDRLRSRFEGGLIVDVQMPDLETRVAILRRKAMQRNLVLPDDIANVIATFISTNVRELEGVLNKISAISLLCGRPITMQVVQNILSELIKQGK
ncbi:MAG: DnaA/Hda family protein [bacterium]|nr:DnaA/Hda family protein [bacterium]